MALLLDEKRKLAKPAVTEKPVEVPDRYSVSSRYSGVVQRRPKTFSQDFENKPGEYGPY